MARHYEFSDAMLPVGERPHYCKFRVWDDRGREMEFYTTRNLEGYFIHEKDGTYRQYEGLMQFGMPKTPGGIRNRLRRMFDETEEEYESQREWDEHEEGHGIL